MLGLTTGNLLAISIILGIIVIIASVYTLKYKIVEKSKWFKYRIIAVIVLTLGFIIHIIGDFLSSYGGESMELSVESIAHVILFIGFIFFIYASKEILAISKEYGYNVK